MVDINYTLYDKLLIRFGKEFTDKIFPDLCSDLSDSSRVDLIKVLSKTGRRKKLEFGGFPGIKGTYRD